MQIVKRISCILICLMSYGLAAEQPGIDPLDMIQDYGIPVNGTFNQEKHFNVLKNPIRSSGSFAITEKGLEWRTTQPVQSAVLLLDNQLWLENSRGERTLQPNAQSVAVILKAVLTGDKPAIKQYFNASQSEQENCINLTPGLESMKVVVMQLSICSLDSGYRIAMIDSNDVKTDIDISIDMRLAENPDR